MDLKGAGVKADRFLKKTRGLIDKAASNFAGKGFRSRPDTPIEHIITTRLGKRGVTPVSLVVSTDGHGDVQW